MSTGATRRTALELLGGVILLAMIPENPVVGGTVLRRAAIQSPNFVTGASGWSVNQDGSAEFNNLVIRNGQIISGTALFYSGPAAAGNLIASVAAAAGTDSKGNAYLAGVTSYDTVLIQAVNLANAAVTYYTAGTEAGPWTALGQMADGLWSEPATSGLNLKVGAVPAQLQLTSTLVDCTVKLQADAGITISEATNALGGLLLATNTQAAPTNPVFVIRGQGATDRLFGIDVAGDSSRRFIINPNGDHSWGPGNAGQDASLLRSAAHTLAVNNADLDINTIGRGLQIAEGTNARMGVATLVGGTKTVANTTVTGSTRIFLSVQSAGGTQGFLRISSVSIGTNFTITSTSGADTSQVAWLLVEPG